MAKVSLILLAFSGVITMFGLFGGLVKERLYLSEAMIAASMGVFLGPEGLNLINPLGLTSSISNFKFISFIKEYSKILICIQIITSTMNLPKNFLKKEFKSIIAFLGPITLLMWIVSSIGLKILFDFDYKKALLIGACITPTDPILANSILKGRFAKKNIPDLFKFLIIAESCGNDGVVYPLIYFPRLFYQEESNICLYKWFIKYVIIKTLSAVTIGTILGFFFSWTIQISNSYKLVERCSFLVYSVTLGILISSIATLLECNEFIAVFFAGIAFSWDGWIYRETKEDNIQEVLDLLLNIIFFVIFGSIMPWKVLIQIGIWKVAIFCGILLLLKRFFAVFVLKNEITSLSNKRNFLLIGWFGPVGVGTIYYISSLIDDGTLELDSDGYVISMMTVFISIVLYGFTVPIILISTKKGINQNSDSCSIATGKDVYCNTDSVISKIFEQGT